MTAAPYTTLAELFLRAAKDAERGAIFYGIDRKQDFRPYGALAAGARRFASALRARGVRPGDRVALILQTSPGFYHAFFGAALAGAAPTCLYPPVRLGRLAEYHARTARMLRAVGANLVVTDRTIRRLLGETRAASGADFALVEELEIAPDDGRAPHAASSEDLAFIQFSSGTTVDPKPVALSHANVLANLAAIAAAFPGDHRRHSAVSWLPLYHDMGLVGSLCLALVTPTNLTLLKPDHFIARPILWLQALSDTGATIAVAPNFAYGLCVDRIRDDECAGLDLSRWEAALNGAESVHPATMERFLARFSPYGLRREVMTPVYGLAEATLAVTFSPPFQGARATAFDAEALEKGRRARPGGARTRLLTSLGRPLPGVRVEIRGESGEPLPEGRVGVVHASGPSLMTGYFGRPEATAEALRGGWLDTGDLGFLHEGELYLCGRKKDLLILRGRNHDPAAFEQAAGRAAGVRTGCVVAVADLSEGEEERLILFAERRGETEDVDDVAAGVRQAVLEETGVAPDEVVLLAPGTIPRTSSGKLRRAETFAQWRAGALAPPERVTWLSVTRALARSGVAHMKAEIARER